MEINNHFLKFIQSGLTKSKFNYSFCLHKEQKNIYFTKYSICDIKSYLPLENPSLIPIPLKMSFRNLILILFLSKL